MKISVYFFPIVYLLSSALVPVSAQSDSLLSLLNDLSESETAYDDLLQDLHEHPIQINYADKDDFLQLPLMSGAMADSILSHRQKNGPFQYVRQLRSIMGKNLYDLLKPFLTTQVKGYNEFMVTQRSIYNTTKNPAIESGKFKGSALNTYSRLTYRFNPHINFGLISQKDPGESSFTDHLNFYFQYKKMQWNIILGDYFVQFGQGLSQSNSYGSKKSIYLSAVFREASSSGRPNLSSQESAGKFGLFIQNTFSNTLSFFGFYSNAKRDGQLTKNILSGISSDGLHRSKTEIARKNYFAEVNWGAGLKFNFEKWLSLSLLINRYTFSKTIHNSPRISGEKDFRRHYFNFSGNHLNQAGLSYSAHFKNLALSGEYSSSDIGKPGWIQTAYYSKKRFNIGIKYWQLDKNFQSIDGRSFNDSSPFPRGVKGYFAGIRFRLSPKSTVSAFKMAEQNSWRTYFDPLPTIKSEWLSQWDLRHGKIDFMVRFKSKLTEEFITQNSRAYRNERRTKTLRLHLAYKANKTVQVRTRWEHTNVLDNSENGSLFFQELKYLLSPNISITARYTLFNTDSWSSRLYEYEPDLPGTFSNLPLYGNGRKTFLLLKWKLSEKFSFWLKWRYVSKNDMLRSGHHNQLLNREVRGQLQCVL